MEKTIRELIKVAMIEKNKDKQITYKSILENAQKIAKRDNRDLTDDDIINAIKNEIKQLSDLAEYVEAGTDAHKTITNKINYCYIILPKMATPEEIKSHLVNNNIDKNMGACMKALKEHFGANMDGKIASGVAKEYCK